MKLTSGQILALVVTLVFAAFYIYDVPFMSATAVAAASSQVVYAPIFDPPMINGVAGTVDFPLLALELLFVAFVGGAIFFAASQKAKKH